ncbi:hypothetical protein LTR28_009756 [Elasticomyces elasticus]|nr:hypothetical protein LTR28_009756 [Elasticomyces elasticus]
MLDSPNLGQSVGWPNLGHGERLNLSGSLGSVNMIGSHSGSSDSDDEDLMDPDDNDETIMTTPQGRKFRNASDAVTPFASRTNANSNNTWSNVFSPAAASLMKTFQQTRLRKRRSRKSSSSASGHSSMASPRTTSPPPMRSIEAGQLGYFGWAKAANNRRESLALGTDQLHLSSSNDSGDEAGITAPSTPGVVRRPVTRRGNLLPKTKGFARIRAALMEESTPVDTEVRREAETIRQVRERDNDVDHQSLSARSSPNILPTVPGIADCLENIPEDSAMGLDAFSEPNRGLALSFSRHASRNSGGMDYWNKFNKDMRTPPPPNLLRHSSSSIFADVNMDSPFASTSSDSRAQSNGPQNEPLANNTGANPSAYHDPPPPPGIDPTKKFNKRRREDDFDIASIKRRAVSPGMSVHNSPVLTQSPQQRETPLWGLPPRTGRENSVSEGPLLPQRSNSGGSTVSMTSTVTAGTGPGGGPGTGVGKRVGLQGMVDTSDGLMKMSIE